MIVTVKSLPHYKPVQPHCEISALKQNHERPNQIPMCEITATSSIRRRFEHVMIKVKTCSRFRKENDTPCYESHEFCHELKVDERIQNDHKWYQEVTACKNYKQEDPKKKELDHSCKIRGGPCAGVTAWNAPEVIALFRENAKKPYNLPLTAKTKIQKFLAGKSQK